MLGTYVNRRPWLRSTTGRVLQIVLAGIPALIILAGCQSFASSKTCVMTVKGRQIIVPVPVGMTRYNMSRDGFSHYFAPADFVARWDKEGNKGTVPYLAEASARGQDEQAATRVMGECRVARLDSAATEVHAAWQQAMRSALAGGSRPLPEAPLGLLAVERVTPAANLIMDVVHLRRDTSSTLMGVSTVLVKGRAVELLVLLSQPKDERDLARVRGELVAWTEAFQAANRE